MTTGGSSRQTCSGRRSPWPSTHAAALRALAQQVGALQQRRVEAVERRRGVAQRELRPQQHLAVGGLLALEAGRRIPAP